MTGGEATLCWHPGSHESCKISEMALMVARQCFSRHVSWEHCPADFLYITPYVIRVPWIPRLDLSINCPAGYQQYDSTRMAVSTLLVSLFALGAIASPVEKRAVIDHDAVVGFAETVPSGTVGSVYEAYQPFLKVVNGCVPFPAVDSAGNTRYVALL